MDNAGLLVVGMAEQCKALIQKSEQVNLDLPRAIHPQHLMWMCERILEHAEEWPRTKLHRWIGFIQCGMMANRISDFEETKAMFDEAKQTYGVDSNEDDLVDHLDPESSFKLDIGGQG
jgi:hypothetical protein